MTIHVLSQRLGEPDDEEPDEVPVVSRRGQPCVLPDASRGMGIFFCATRGAGKSRSLGRAIAWGDLERKIPLVVLDPLGGTIDNLLDKIGRQPLARRRELWERVRYVNVNGQDGRIVAWPIYYRSRKGERLSEQSQRLIEVIARSDPALRQASIYGLNSLAPIAKAAGIVLSALNMGVTELWALVSNPKAWKDRLESLKQQRPETAQAVDELEALGELHDRDRAQQLYSLRSKLSLFRFNPNFAAIFGATTPGIDWQEVVDKKLAVLIDFRDIFDDEVRKFCLLWIYNSFITFVKQRGHGSMDSPISFIVDELSFLAGDADLNDRVLARDMNELVHRIARSHGIWLTLATQELFQLSSQVRQTVLSMGTVIFGQTSDDQAAEELARRYFPYDPYRVKKSRSMYQSAVVKGRGYRESFPVSVGEQTTEYTKGEQNYLNSRVFLQLQPFHFLLGQSQREGQLPTSLRQITLAGLDPGEYPDKILTRKLRSQLMRRDGSKESVVAAQIRQRLAGPVAPPVGEEQEQTTSTNSPAEPAPEGLLPLRSTRSRKPPKSS